MNNNPKEDKIENVPFWKFILLVLGITIPILLLVYFIQEIDNSSRREHAKFTVGEIIQTVSFRSLDFRFYTYDKNKKKWIEHRGYECDCKSFNLDGCRSKMYLREGSSVGKKFLLMYDSLNINNNVLFIDQPLDSLPLGKVLDGQYDVDTLEWKL